MNCVNQARLSNTYEKLPSIFIDDVILQAERSFHSVIFSRNEPFHSALVSVFSLSGYSVRDLGTIASRIFIFRENTLVYTQFFGVTTCVL